MILATFNIRPGKDGMPEGRYQNGLVRYSSIPLVFSIFSLLHTRSHPEFFECSITARSHEAVNLMKEIPEVH